MRQLARVEVAKLKAINGWQVAHDRRSQQEAIVDETGTFFRWRRRPCSRLLTGVHGGESYAIIRGHGTGNDVCSGEDNLTGARATQIGGFPEFVPNDVLRLTNNPSAGSGVM
mgnify:CR=1 FL=1